MGDGREEEEVVGDVNSNLLLISPSSTGDAELDQAVRQWLAWDKVGTDLPALGGGEGDPHLLCTRMPTPKPCRILPFRGKTSVGGWVPLGRAVREGEG